MLDEVWLGERSDAEMCALEDVYIPVLGDFFELLDLPALIRAQGFQVDLLEDFPLHILDGEIYRSAIHFRILALEGMSEIVYESLWLQFFLFGHLVEMSDMFICDSTFLISMEEDLGIERNIHLVSID